VHYSLLVNELLASQRCYIDNVRDTRLTICHMSLGERTF